MPMVERMIAELSINPLITDKVEEIGKFDTECITKDQEDEIFADAPAAGEEDPEAAAEQANEETALMLFGVGAVAAAVGIYAYMKWKK